MRQWVKCVVGVAAAVMGMAGASASSQAATSCTPSAGYDVCWTYTYTGADETLAIPNGITHVNVRAFGAAGGGANSTWYTLQGGGAGGGYATAVVPVTGGTSLTVMVGKGGIPNSTATTYGGGGGGGGSSQTNTIGGSGGGMSAVFSSSTKTAANALVIAAGGGGASPGSDGGTTSGSGGGGGTTGGNPGATWNGGGGTQTAGGAAGAGTSGCTTAPTAGSQFQGGSGGVSSAAGSHEGGGGGGGGYFGGGGGLCQSGATQNGGGGGGSSYTIATALSASTASGSNWPYSGAACAGSSTSGGASDSFYTAGIGVGSCYGTGGNGKVVIQYAFPKLTLTKVSVGGTGTFTFTGTNGWSSQNITTATSGVGVAGATQTLNATSATTAITETVPAGYTLASASCTGMGSGGTATLVGNVLTLNTAATANGASVACTFTNNKIPTLKLQKTTVSGFGGPFSFTQSNLASTPGNITTLAAGTPTPSSPTAINITTINQDVTLTETVASGFFISGAGCTDANSAVTGNTGSIGTRAGTLLTIPAANVKAGAVFTCVFTNTKELPALSITKAANNVGPVIKGQTVTYTYTITNSGNVPMSNVTVSDSHNGYGTVPVPGSETLVTDAAPTGDTTDATSGNAVWSTLGVGDTIRFTSTYLVTQADIDLHQ